MKNRIEIQERLEVLQAQLQEFEAKDLDCGDGQDCLVIVVSRLLNLYMATAFYSPKVALNGLGRVVAWIEGEAVKSLTGEE